MNLDNYIFTKNGILKEKEIAYEFFTILKNLMFRNSMNPIKNLLLAVDFTDHSKITLQRVINFCKECNSNLSLVHVLSNANHDIITTEKICNEKINEIANLVIGENIEVPFVKVKVGLGDVENYVVDFAENINANAIVVGSGNFHQSKKHRLGGTAEGILRESKLPVLIIKNTLLPLKGPIACPLDLSPSSEVVLKIAIEYAKHVGGELVIIHAVEPVGYGYVDSVVSVEPDVYNYTDMRFDHLYANKDFFQNKSIVMDNYLKNIDFQGVKWSKKILLGSPATEVITFINKLFFVMTIMNSASRIGISRFILGSVAESITRNIDSPCLVLKDLK
jgi:nucleotide-binding universal stress UspA family protein